MLDFLLGFLIPIPETGGGLAYSPYRWGPKDAPIHMEACEASAQIYRGVVYKSTLWYGAAFKIAGDKTADEVRLRFTFTDDKWQPVAVEEQSVTGTFTPGAKISRTTKSGGQFKHANTQPKAAAVLCSPIAVHFTDGTSWTWNPPATPYPLPGATYPSPLPVPAAGAVPARTAGPARNAMPMQTANPARTAAPVAPQVRPSGNVQIPQPAGAELDYE